MLPLKSESTALVLIDVQEGFKDPSWGKRNNPNAEQKIEELLNLFRQLSLSVIHVQHLSTDALSPLRPGQPGVNLMGGVTPQNGESVFQKQVNSAFIGTGLEEHLHSQGIRSLVIVGFTSDHCVSTSVRMAANLGFNVLIAADATVAFERRGRDSMLAADLVHEFSLASLSGEFATITTVSQIKVLFEFNGAP